MLVADCDKADAYNDASYVLRVSHGSSSVLLPGGVEPKGLNDMIDAGLDLSADVLVASHHGRKSGYSEAAVSAIKPSAVIISTMPAVRRRVPRGRVVRVDQLPCNDGWSGWDG